MSPKVKWEKPKIHDQMDLSTEDQSPVEEVPAEQTRVYQNQPSLSQNPTPTSGSTVLQKTQLKQTVKKKPGQNRITADDVNQNWIDEERRTPSHRLFTDAGLDSDGAIWVTDVTEQPGFLFPVARTSALPTGRRHITEEASLTLQVRYFLLAFLKF